MLLEWRIFWGKQMEISLLSPFQLTASVSYPLLNWKSLTWNSWSSTNRVYSIIKQSIQGCVWKWETATPLLFLSVSCLCNIVIQYHECDIFLSIDNEILFSLYSACSLELYFLFFFLCHCLYFLSFPAAAFFLLSYHSLYLKLAKNICASAHNYNWEINSA